MKANQISLKEQSFIFNTQELNAGQHYTFLMKLGRVLPTTKPQAMFFVNNNLQLDVLNIVDVQRVEAILNEFGFEGEYKYTKNNHWVRLVNFEALHQALKLKYNF